MERAYKFRIYPSKKQKELIDKTLGCSRYVYNYFRNLRETAYNESKETLNYYDCSKKLTLLKQELGWLKEVDKWALQTSIKDLDTAYTNFFKHNAKYPKFKSKKDRNVSYRSTNSSNSIEFTGKSIKLPKLKKVKCKGYKNMQGRILNATISRTPSGKYYVSLCCTDVVFAPYSNTNNHIGLDLGIKTLIVSSNGEEYVNPKYYESALIKLKKLQQSLSRKTIGGNNWNKARIKVARLHEHIVNQRKDYLHKISNKLVEDYDVICIEDLKVSNMIKNKNLSKSIASASWGELKRQLDYKSSWYGKKLIKVNTFFASSQLCSVCGNKNSDVKNLNVRTWCCENCNTSHDRDINAAKNILKEGLKQIA